jgi:hypothetical protein
MQWKTMSMSMSSSNISPLMYPLVRYPPPSLESLLPPLYIVPLICTILSARMVSPTDRSRTPLPLDGIDNINDEDFQATEIA